MQMIGLFITPVICLLIVNSLGRPISGSISQLNFTLTYSRVLTTSNSHDYLKVSGQCMFIGLADGTIEQRNFTNNNTLVKLFNNTLSNGRLVQALQINQGKLITIHNNRLIAVWNITTGQLIKYKYSSYTVFRSAFLKQRNILVIGIKQQRGFQLIEMKDLNSTILFYDPINYTNHRFAVSPNQQIIIDWQTPNLPVRILNLSISGVSIIQQYIGNYSYVYERFIALFSSDSNELIYCTNGSLNFHNIRNSYYPSKKIQVLSSSLQITSLIFLNEEQKIYFISKVGNQSLVYDQINNQSITFTSPNSQGDVLSQNKQYIIRFHQTMVSVFKINCISGYFYNKSATLCQPCSVNNCSLCDSDTGVCYACIQNKQYVTVQGRCLPCPQFCQSCQNNTGFCQICEQPYEVNNQFQCSLPAQKYLYIFKYVIAILYTNKLKITALLIMFLNQFELYNYHHRQYGNNTLSYLKPISILQLSKWFILPPNSLDFVFNPLKIFSSYSFYTNNEKFVEETQLDFNFWNSIFYYFVYTIPEALLVYIVLRFVFILLFNFKISVFFRQYSFYLFIMPCIFANYIEYLIYTAGNQLQNFMYLTIWDKLCLLMFILFFFMLFLYIIAFPFLVLAFHRKTKKYFFDDCSPNIMGAFMLNLFSTYQAFILSIVQSFLYQKYLLQMLLMIGTEICVLLGLLVLQKRYSCFEKKATFCIIVLHQCLMIIFNSILILDHYFRVRGDTEVMDLTDSIVQVIILCILANICVYMLNCLIPSNSSKKPNETKKKQDERRKSNKSNKSNKLQDLSSVIQKDQSAPVNSVHQIHINKKDIEILSYEEQVSEIVHETIIKLKRKKQIHVKAKNILKKKKEIAIKAKNGPYH